ncbi:unnamed protein product [Ectocarpus sp. 12 AP-2014]
MMMTVVSVAAAAKSTFAGLDENPTMQAALEDMQVLASITEPLLDLKPGGLADVVKETKPSPLAHLGARKGTALLAVTQPAPGPWRTWARRKRRKRRRTRTRNKTTTTTTTTTTKRRKK